jgi:hypothetical protein
MYAVVGMWTMDPERQETQEQELRERIVPSVSATPGFVRGSWSREIAGTRGASFIVFDNEPSARVFIDSVRANAPRQRTAGVFDQEFLLVELLADA